MSVSLTRCSCQRLLEDRSIAVLALFIILQLWVLNWLDSHGHGQVLELLESGEISQDQWQMPEKEEQDELWDFDDLDDFEEEDDDDDDYDNYDDESDSPSISSSACSIHAND